MKSVFFCPMRIFRTARPIVENSPWLTDLNRLGNQLNSSLLPKSKEEAVIRAQLTQITQTTGLFEALVDILDVHLVERPSIRREIIVYSDGNDEISGPKAIEELTAKATDKGVPIHIVYIPTGKRNSVLEDLAKTTGGTVYENHPLEASNVITKLAEIYASPVFCTLAYRSQQKPPARVEIQQIQVQTDPNNRTATVAEGSIRARALQAPTVKIKAPGPGEIITMPEGLTITAIWGPGQASTMIENGAYYVAGGAGFSEIYTVPVDALGYSLELPVSGALTVGHYLFTASVTDEFGLMGTDIHSFEIRNPPTATPIPTPTPGPIELAHTTFMSQKRWWEGDPTRRQWLLGTELLIPTLTFLLIGLFFRRRPNIIKYEEPEPGKRSEGLGELYAMLVRERGDIRAPQSRQQLRLYRNQDRRIPHDLLVQENQRFWFNKKSGEQYEELYEAEIVYREGGAYISRSVRVDPDKPKNLATRQEPIGIRLARAKTTFPLIGDNNSVEYGPLQPGDILQFGDLHYRYAELNPVGDGGPSDTDAGADSKSAQNNGSQMDTPQDQSHGAQ